MYKYFPLILKSFRCFAKATKTFSKFDDQVSNWNHARPLFTPNGTDDRWLGKVSAQPQQIVKYTFPIRLDPQGICILDLCWFPKLVSQYRATQSGL